MDTFANPTEMWTPRDTESAVPVICPLHGREHQPRERQVACLWCHKPTWQFAGAHTDCQLAHVSKIRFAPSERPRLVCVSAE